MDEAAEREEQELIARREMAMREMAEAQEAQERQQRMDNGEDVEDEDEGARDLDDDVPEGSVSADDEDEDEDVGEHDGELDLDADVPSAEESEGELDEEDVTFEEEDSAIIASLLSANEAEMSGAAQEARDLDDDIPEAGSYQHTDTDFSSSSSEDERQSRGPPGSASARAAQWAMPHAAPRAEQFRARVRAGLDFAPLQRPQLLAPSGSGVMVTPEQQGRQSTSFLSADESSFLESSPAMARRAPRGQAPRRGRGR